MSAFPLTTLAQKVQVATQKEGPTAASAGDTAAQGTDAGSRQSAYRGDDADSAQETTDDADADADAGADANADADASTDAMVHTQRWWLHSATSGLVGGMWIQQLWPG